LKFSLIKCFKSGEYGPHKSACLGKGNKPVEETKQSEAETALTTLHVMLAVSKREIVPMWILCDNKSTVDVFKN
jgi:hypothetical protein